MWTALRHAAIPSVADLRFAPVMVEGIVTVMVGVAVVAFDVELRLVETGGVAVDVADSGGVLDDAVDELTPDDDVGGVEVALDATLLDGAPVAGCALDVGLLTTDAGSVIEAVPLVGVGVAVALQAASESVTAAISPARRRLMLCTSFV